MFSVHRFYPRSKGRLAALRCAGTPAPRGRRERGLLPRRTASWVAAALLVLAGAACENVDGPRAPGHADVPPFPGSAASLDALGEGVLAALSAGDVAGLQAYRLSETEHNKTVWPELPASAPEVNFPVDAAWMNIETRNRTSLLRIVPQYAGRELSLQGTDCRGETARFQTFMVFTDCWVVFEMAGEEAPLEAQIFEDVLLRGGGHKIFRYYDEEPRSLRPTEAD